MAFAHKAGFMLAAAITAFSAGAHAEGLAGTYRGHVTLLFSDRHVETGGMVLKLSQQDGALAGTAGPTAESQSPVTGLVAGRQLQFDTGKDSEHPLHYDLQRYGAQWRGDVVGKSQGHAVMGRATLLRDPD